MENYSERLMDYLEGNLSEVEKLAFEKALTEFKKAMIFGQRTELFNSTTQKK